MTSTEKARETRRRNIEKRKAKEKEQKQLRTLTREVCKSVLNDPSAKPEDKMKASEIILEMLKKGW